jgi:hypothetical protein
MMLTCPVARRVEVLRRGSWHRLCANQQPNFMPTDAAAVCRALGWIGSLPVRAPADSFGGHTTQPAGSAWLTRPDEHLSDQLYALWDASGGLSFQDTGDCAQAAVSCSNGTGGEGCRAERCLPGQMAGVPV